MVEKWNVLITSGLVVGINRATLMGRVASDPSQFAMKPKSGSSTSGENNSEERYVTSFYLSTVDKIVGTNKF
jgi:hypothetical protein